MLIWKTQVVSSQASALLSSMGWRAVAASDGLGAGATTTLASLSSSSPLIAYSVGRAWASAAAQTAGFSSPPITSASM
jgi:hypothetical protein